MNIDIIQQSCYEYLHYSTGLPWIFILFDRVAINIDNIQHFPKDGESGRSSNDREVFLC